MPGEFAAEPAAPKPLAPELAAANGRRILIVDDNRDSAASLAMLMELASNETRTAFDGIEAVNAAAVFQPDVVLLDIGMPKLDGYEAARRIREQPWGKNMVLVALTGWGQDGRPPKDGARISSDRFGQWRHGQWHPRAQA